jgi:methyltransferase
MFFWIFISFVILQRLIELFIAKRNEIKMLQNGAVEVDRDGYKYIVLMHSAYFISLILEKNIFERQVNQYRIIFITLFIIAQLLRYWSILSLGVYWNTRIIILKGSRLIKKGPYRFLNHPNYIAVITELAVISLLFSCYITSIIFTILNIFVLKRRIKIEEESLKALTA